MLFDDLTLCSWREFQRVGTAVSGRIVTKPFRNRRVTSS